MKAIRRLNTGLGDLEQDLADAIAIFANELKPLPEDRDVQKLDADWRRVMSARRKLAAFIKKNLKDLDAVAGTTSLSIRKVRDIKRDLISAKRMVRQWGRFETIAIAQMATMPRELLEVEFNPNSEVRVLDHVVTMFLDGMHKIANPTASTQGDAANDHGCHRDIPLPMSNFSKMIAAAHRVCLAQRKDRPLRFLDVGSGGGTKVLAATTCFDLCDGLEYEKSTAETGAKFLDLLAPDKCRLFHGDALTFSDYQDYDVIYFYRPMVNFGKLVEMEERIMSQVKPGTILLAAGGLFSEDLDAKNVQELVGQVYVTGTSASKADELRLVAESMGSMVSGYGRREYRLGYWQPLYDASVRNGYFA